MIISLFDRVENFEGKGEIACTSNFSFSQNVFKKLLSKTHLKVSLCRNELINLKSIDTCQPAQADMGRNFLLSQRSIHQSRFNQLSEKNMDFYGSITK